MVKSYQKLYPGNLHYFSIKEKDWKLNNKNIKVEQAYGAYSNAGVTVSDKNGFAVLTFNKGTGYIVPSGKYIKPHVHYRELNEFGMMGSVKTRYI